MSLSEAEASVASPFTYNQANISCIPRLMREGEIFTGVMGFKFKLQVDYISLITLSKMRYRIRCQLKIS